MQTLEVSILLLTNHFRHQCSLESKCFLRILCLRYRRTSFTPWVTRRVALRRLLASFKDLLITVLPTYPLRLAPYLCVHLVVLLASFRHHQITKRLGSDQKAITNVQSDQSGPSSFLVFPRLAITSLFRRAKANRFPLCYMHLQARIISAATTITTTILALFPVKRILNSNIPICIRMAKREAALRNTRAHASVLCLHPISTPRNPLRLASSIRRSRKDRSLLPSSPQRSPTHPVRRRH